LLLEQVSGFGAIGLYLDMISAVFAGFGYGFKVLIMVLDDR
jgi:hypothetical protein